MIKDSNYINIQGWMLSKLGLKGNNLIIYAIIYGFSQVEGHYFNGSLQYLCEWTNSTRQGVIKNLKELVDLGYVIKQDASPTNIYYVNKVTIDSVNNVSNGVNIVTNDVNSVNIDSEQSLPNNILNNTNNKYIKEREFSNKLIEIISYFNSVCHTNFKSNSKETRKLIKTHLNEGFTVEDFKKVIDSKYKEWGVTPKAFGATGIMSTEYLRPSTLFGNKFESYLYEAKIREESSEGLFNSVSKEVDSDISDLVF